MRKVLFLLGSVMLMTNAAQAEPMQSQINQGYQRPDVKPVKKGYVTKDGKRYGNCKNVHHRRHKHCKVRLDAAPVNNQQKR